MKILFVNGAHPNDKIGGAELQSWLLAKELGKKHEVTFLAIRSDIGNDQECFTDGVNVVRLAKRNKLSFSELINIYHTVKRISPDIIHVRIYEYIVLFAVICIFQRIKVVYHVSHVYDCKPFLEAKVCRGIAKQFMHALNYYSMKRLSGLVCQTMDQKKLLKWNRLPLEIVSNSAAPASPANYCKDDRLVLWVGNIKPIKQPLLFADLAEQLKESSFRFCMIGFPQDKSLARELHERADKLDNFQFIPGIPFQDIGAYFQKASIFVSTSREEGFSNTFIQAIQARTPIISLLVNPDKIVTRYGIGYCAKTEGKLANILRHLENNADDLERMRLNTIQCYYDQFDIEKNANCLDALFNNILAIPSQM